MGTYSNHHGVWFVFFFFLFIIFAMFFYLETIPHIILQIYFIISKSLTIAKVFHSKVLLWREDLIAIYFVNDFRENTLLFFDKKERTICFGSMVIVQKPYLQSATIC